MKKSVLAIAAHPDDIEFVMAGTLMRLLAAGWEAHYFCLANGCCGSNQLSASETAAIRLQEARTAAAALPAQFYPPICNDLEIFYNHNTHAQVTSVVRQSEPTVILTHALSDYMEDHQNAARLAVGGAFARGMKNFASQPACDTFNSEVAIYHAQPHGNRDPLGKPVIPQLFVDVSDLRERKIELLEHHASQAAWLDETQKMNSYTNTMLELNAEVGRMSKTFELAEGWIQHIHLGLSQPNFNPLADALNNFVTQHKGK